MSGHSRWFLGAALAAIIAAAAGPAVATPDPEFPPNAITVLASVDSDGNAMPAKYSGKTDYVCDGDNDEVQIQAAIDAAEDAGGGGEVILIGGKFYLEDTINIDTAAGVTLRGLGAGDSINDDTVSFGQDAQCNITALIWKGSSGGTMLSMDNGWNCLLADMLLFGKDGSSSNVAGKLIHVKWTNGHGSGMHRFNNLFLQSATEGLVYGVNTNDGTCSDTYAQRLGLVNLGKGVVLNNDQSVAHTFVDVRSQRCTTAVFYLYTGGQINVFGGWDGASGAYMQICGGGINVKPILLSGVKMEPSGTSATPILLKGSTCGGQLVNLESCASLGSTEYSQYAIDVSGGMTIEARGCNFSGKIAKLRASSASAPTSLVVDGCEVRTPSDGQWSNFFDLDTTEYCSLKVVNCRDGGHPVAYNAITWPESSEPVIIWSDPVDARTTQTVSMPIYGKGADGKDTMFVPIEVGVQGLIDPTNILSMPHVSWGWPGDNDGLHASVQAYYTPMRYAVDRHTDLPPLWMSNTTRSDSFNASVTAAGEMDSSEPFYIRFYWKGYVMSPP